MFRQSPRRNGSNKGLKIKHILQISLLLGVSVWLLYQVHHSDDKKSPVPPNITKKLHNVVSKDMLRLGRKDLQPKVKDKKETEEHQANEGGNETEPEDLVQDHESEEHEDMKHEEDRENEEETTETEHQQIKGHDNEEINKGRDSNGGKNEKINKQNKVVVMDDKDNTNSNKGPSGDLAIQKESKSESAQIVNSFNKNTDQDSNLMPSVDIKSAIMVTRNSEDSMNLNGEVENQKEQESNENENNEESEGKSEEGGVLEDEKEALTDLGTLPESGIGGSRSTENTAAE